jgi:hypothetical protein
MLNDGAGTVTVNTSGGDTFSVFDGTAATDGVTSFTLQNGQHVSVNNGTGAIWDVRVGAAGGVTMAGNNGDVQVKNTGELATSCINAPASPGPISLGTPGAPCNVAPSASANVAIKPTVAAQQVQYVDAVNGNDANDGLSWGSAKQHGCTAWDALESIAPYNTTYGHYSTSGRIYLSATYNTRLQWCNEVPGNGLWILGYGERNYITKPQMTSVQRSSNVVTITFTANAYGKAWPLYVADQTQVNGYIRLQKCVDTSFNGVFPVTSMPAQNQITWNQIGANASTTGCEAMPGGFRATGGSSIRITGGAVGNQGSTILDDPGCNATD